MNKMIFSLLLICQFYMPAVAQYENYVEVKTSYTDSEPYGILKMSRKDNHVKVKYFAAKDNDGTSVYERYQKWAAGKKVIAYTSGTYMNNCETPGIATPIGICIDQGKVVNSVIMPNNLDALAVVYATGGMIVSNLDDKNLKITVSSGTLGPLDIRGNSYHMTRFLKWADEYDATVFQTHLYVFEDNIKISEDGSSKIASRRFLAVCKEDNGDITHFIINIPGNSTEYNGVIKAYNILKKLEDVNQIVFMINLDTGCQNVFSCFNNKNTAYNHALLKGTESINSAINLLAYYYE